MFSFEYMNKIGELLHEADQRNHQEIKKMAHLFAKNIMEDKIIHTFGTGHSHMIGIELFARAGGLGNVNAILDPDTLTSFGARRSSEVEKLTGMADIIFNSYRIKAGDIMIITSNSGRNSLPIEMAIRCKKEGVYVVALTNVNQSKNAVSRHPSGKKLYEYADSILDNAVADGDCMMNIDGILTGPGSSIASMFILNTIVVEAIKICREKGFSVPAFQSQNVDGFDNDAIYSKYENRIKHF